MKPTKPATIFDHFSGLKDNLPYVNLCKLPTPIKKAKGLGDRLGLQNLYIKHDGLTAQPFGGNKVRKLEFLLADAVKQEAEEVMTFGFAGSNHALATAVYAKQLGMKSISMLMPQTNHPYVQRNLLAGLHFGAEFHVYRNKRLLRLGARYQQWRHKKKYGKTPYTIPPGGSSPLGAVGFVNAAFELKQQIDTGVMPEPDIIYVTLGSAGTAMGLWLGLKTLKLNCRIIPIRVVDHDFLSKQMCLDLFGQTAQLLHSLDPSFPLPDTAEVKAEMNIRNEFLGEGYAKFNAPGREAISIMKETENIDLDGTYTGKTLAALVADARNNQLKNKTVLFWNTLNAHEQSAPAKDSDWRDLPRSLRKYF